MKLCEKFLFKFGQVTSRGTSEWLRPLVCGLPSEHYKSDDLTMETLLVYCHAPKDGLLQLGLKIR